MKSLSRFVLALILTAFLVQPGISQEQVPTSNLSGTWELSMTAILPDQTMCGFEGSAQITQRNGTVTGTALQNRVSGPESSCPATMSANLMGTLDGNQIAGTLDGGPQFGTADFSGTVGADGISVTGVFSTPVTTEETAVASLQIAPMGPFPGITGNWQAQVRAADIPVLSGTALVALVALLLFGGVAFLRRAAA